MLGFNHLFLLFLSPKIFEMMDAKARQDCVKEIGLLKVSAPSMTGPSVTEVRRSAGTGCLGL